MKITGKLTQLNDCKLLKKTKMTIEIKNTDGKWLINGKPYNECNYTEQRYFIEFINSFKYAE